MLKTALFDCVSMKNVAVLTKDGAFIFSSPPQGIWQLKSPHPWEFAIQRKKNARGSARGRGLGAAEIDWCITNLLTKATV